MDNKFTKIRHVLIDLFLLCIFLRKELKSLILDRFDFFMTRSQFHSSHLLGLFSKKNSLKKNG